MSMKSLPYPHKHNCPRENCLGHTKEYSNYLQLTKTKPKSKPSKTARSFHSLHDKAIKDKPRQLPKSKPSKQEPPEQTELNEQRRRSEELEELLQEKAKKINDMKHRIKDYEGRVREFEKREKEFEVKARQYEVKLAQLQAALNESEHPKSPISLEKPSQSMMNHYQQQLKLLEASQKSTLDAVEKYRLIEREFHDYRTESERKVERLVRENEQLRQYEPEDKAYDQEISSLRKELHRLSQTQHSPSIEPHEEDTSLLKSQVRQLMVERQNLQMALRQKEESSLVMRRNLEAINRKVDRWNEEYKQMTEERRTLEQKYNDLVERHAQRKERQAREKEEWAAIFRELMHEVEKLKKEISRLQRSNHKLVQLRADENE